MCKQSPGLAKCWLHTGARGGAVAAASSSPEAVPAENSPDLGSRQMGAERTAQER